MSLRYTAVDSMEPPALGDVERTVERWREKIEVRLDNRQVFFLFFGSAVVACMLFVLGVMVGKRIESRGQAEAPTVQDPLAALDRARQPPLGVAAPDPQLSFPSTLIGAAPKAKLASARTAAPGPKAAGSKQSAVPKISSPVAKSPLALGQTAAPIAKPPAAPAAKMPTFPARGATTTPDPLKTKGKYTLQISTFVTSAEAAAFAQRYPGAFVVAGDVPGKGLSYRVRFGNFMSYRDATAAKDAFEKQHNQIALVAVR